MNVYKVSVPVFATPEAYLSAIDMGVPFLIQRVYWITCGVKGSKTAAVIERGNHAHHKTHQLFVCLSGTVTFEYQEPHHLTGVVTTLHKFDSQALVVPAMVWHSMKLTPGTILLALASSYHDEKDYIRDYEEWKSLWQK